VRIAILANNKNSYVRPMAEGLQRMLTAIGVEGQIFYDGLEQLRNLPPLLKTYVRNAAHGSTPKNILKYFIKEVPSFYPFIRRLQAFDVVVVVNSLVEAYLKDFFRDETLRWFLPHTPIVLYDVFYLPTRGPWRKWLKEGNLKMGVLKPGNWGLERYDWYLCASVVSETPMPRGLQPYSLIGLNLADVSLRQEPKKEFIALIDFEIPDHMHEREIQILACEKTKTKYIALKGGYSIYQIREIYRKCGIYFLAHRESFGVPICELQACGAYVFTPYAKWCPSHWLKSDLSQEGPGDLSPNFIVYDNDKDTLVREIQRIKASYDPQQVVDTFRQYHHQLYYGDKFELKKFVHMVEKGEIHSKSHKEYASFKAPELSVAFG